MCVIEAEPSVAMRRSERLRLYPQRNAPLLNPVQSRHFVKAPSSLGNATHFCAYRGNGNPDELDAYLASGLGDVMWPDFSFFSQPNLSGILHEIKQRNIFV